jgi:hypothetical protein
MTVPEVAVTHRSNYWQFPADEWWTPTRGARLARASDGLAARCAALVAVRPDAVFVGRTAAALWGCSVAAPGAPIETVMPSSSAGIRREGHRRRRRDIPREHVTLRDGLWLTTPERTLVDLAADVPLALLVAFGDHILREKLATQTSISDCVAGAGGQRGVRRARQGIDLLDARAESPPESILRVTLISAGLPAPIPQHVITSRSGEFLARGDLAYPAERIVIEYDGQHHLSPAQQSKDADRRHRLSMEGWWVVTVTAWDLRDPRRAVRKVNEALIQRRYSR